MNWKALHDFIDPATPAGTLAYGVLGGIILLGLQRIFKWLQLLISNFMLFRLNVSYSLSGYWVSYEVKDDELSIINFNKIIQRKHKVQFHVWQYSNQNTPKQFKRYYAEGIMKGNHLSAFFYSVDNHLPETGAFTCKQEGKRLVGKYIQYSVDRKTADLISSPEDYSLIRLNLPGRSKLRMLFAFPPFETSAEALSFMKSHEAQPKWRS